MWGGERAAAAFDEGLRPTLASPTERRLVDIARLIADGRDEGSMDEGSIHPRAGRLACRRGPVGLPGGRAEWAPAGRPARQLPKPGHTWPPRWSVSRPRGRRADPGPLPCGYRGTRTRSID
ncbi:hypothetical protein GCM10010211_77790 [Streptomyces albospinus]|uniref:Uncharacterized protein n=1 Tax=Streptomyces albospinus TaxID=285515 RepID=A0ABQ2VMN2_9ACTN|nr:hypothetical protein GCM10010211_77790 [Streptomyces albospinus]